jgi:predicted Fe-Mo cluster-binding NifX family protein
MGDSDDDDDKFIEVKVWSSGIYASKARQIVKQGVSAVIAAGAIAPDAKEIFRQAGVRYWENVEPSDLESESGEVEGGE